jgi:hypothetical protein
MTIVFPVIATRIAKLYPRSLRNISVLSGLNLARNVLSASWRESRGLRHYSRYASFINLRAASAGAFPEFTASTS